MYNHIEGIKFIATFVILLLLFIFTGSVIFLTAVLTMLFYSLISVLLYMFQGRNFDLKITADSEAMIDKTYQIVVEIRNNSKFPIFGFKCGIVSRNLLNDEITKDTIKGSVWLGRGESIPIAKVSKHYGEIESVIDTVVFSDPIGILKREAVRKERQYLANTLVVPEDKEIEIIPEISDRYDVESFRYAENQVGDDISETVGIRDYRLGDDIRRVHWKLTAKTGDVLVRELGLPVDNNLLILSEKNFSSYSEKEDLYDAIDYVTELTLLMVSHLARKDVHLALGWEDKRKGIVITNISSLDDYYSALHEFVSTPVCLNNYNIVRYYLSANNGYGFNNYIVVTDDSEGIDQEDINKLREFGHVELFDTKTIKQHT